MLRDVEKNFNAIGNVVGSLSTLAAETTFQGEKRPNRALESWEDNESMFTVVESALSALERAKKTNRSEFVELAEMRYEKAIGDYRKLCRGSTLT